MLPVKRFSFARLHLLQRFFDGLIVSIYQSLVSAYYRQG